MTKYSLKSGRFSHLGGWVIEGSNDGRFWKELDRRNECLQDRYSTKTYECGGWFDRWFGRRSSESFRYLRLHASRKCWTLCPSEIEFFGTLQHNGRSSLSGVLRASSGSSLLLMRQSFLVVWSRLSLSRMSCRSPAKPYIWLIPGNSKHITAMVFIDQSYGSIATTRRRLLKWQLVSMTEISCYSFIRTSALHKHPLFWNSLLNG